MAPAGRHDGRTQLVWAPLVATCQIDGGRPQLLLLYIVDACATPAISVSTITSIAATQSLPLPLLKIDLPADERDHSHLSGHLETSLCSHAPYGQATDRELWRSYEGRAIQSFILSTHENDPVEVLCLKT